MVYVSNDFVCAMWNDVSELFIKSFSFVYVSDSCLGLKQMLCSIV